MIISAKAQQIAPTNSYLYTQTCGTCVPTNWNILANTPDTANKNQVAEKNAILDGDGALWVSSPLANDASTYELPLPPNNHKTFIALRDRGPGFEEIVSTELTNLTIGDKYAVYVYVMTATTDKSGRNNKFYGGTYEDKFYYKIEHTTAKRSYSLNNTFRNKWRHIKIRFTAQRTTETLKLYTGSNAGTSNNQQAQPILFSVTENAINTFPVAVDDNTSMTTNQTNTIVDIVANDYDKDSNRPAPMTNDVYPIAIDIDPGTSGIQKTKITAEGSWSVDNAGKVTFTPVSGFIGQAKLIYGVRDNFKLDGQTFGVWSNKATITVDVVKGVDIKPSKPEVTVTEDADNDGVITDNEIIGKINIRIDIPQNSKEGDVLTIIEPDSNEKQVILTSEIIENPYFLEYSAEEFTEGKVYKIQASIKNPVNGLISDKTEDTFILKSEEQNKPKPEIKEELEKGNVIILNELSPNGDGINDSFKILGIENYPNNTLSIFNRWGSEVYTAKPYNNEKDPFIGISKGKVTIASSNKLPTGTYFYLLDFGIEGKKPKKGWIYIQN